MSRRRKLGDSPGPKRTPRQAAATAAAEECSSVAESGKRRLRSARGSGLRGAGEGSLPPVPQPEQPSVAASCGKSNSGEGDAASPGMLGWEGGGVASAEFSFSGPLPL